MGSHDHDSCTMVMICFKVLSCNYLRIVLLLLLVISQWDSCPSIAIFCFKVLQRTYLISGIVLLLLSVFSQWHSCPRSIASHLLNNVHFSNNKGHLGVPQLPGQGCSFYAFSTNTYKLSLLETPSGIKVLF